LGNRVENDVILAFEHRCSIWRRASPSYRIESAAPSSNHFSSIMPPILPLITSPDGFASITVLLGVIIAPIITTAINPSFIPSHLSATIIYLALILAFAKYLARGGVANVHRDLTGHTVVLTGAAAGIGKASAVHFASLGALVIVGVRGQRRAEQEAQQIHDSARGKGAVKGFHLDLSNLKTVREFAENVAKNCNGRVDILVNNAGIMASPYERTADGFEMQIGTNHFGHFYLTEQLLPLLLKSKGRVVNLSSVGHFFAPNGIDLEEQLDPKRYHKWVAYGQSKLANIYFTQELQRRYGDKGLNSYAVHPGSVKTELMRHNLWEKWLVTPVGLIVLKTALQGSQTTLYAALEDSKKLKPGGYYMDCKLGWMSPQAEDQQKAQRFWELSEKLIREKAPK
jgi:NAD(P)-dependent dehydrogenase (short-subunit alcohol dehydrogenase family)